MKAGGSKHVRCAIYTRVSTDQGLEQDFNSLDAQYDASQAYIRSQAHAGWTLVRGKYDDGGFSGGDTDRPALQRLLDDIRAGKVDVIVVYKVDRLTRFLADFAKLHVGGRDFENGSNLLNKCFIRVWLFLDYFGRSSYYILTTTLPHISSSHNVM